MPGMSSETDDDASSRSDQESAETILQREDPRLEPYLDLRDRDLERRDGLFVGEGPLTVERMLASPGVAHSLLVAERWRERYRDLGVPVLVADETLIGEAIGFPFHRGVLALGRRAPFENRDLSDLLPKTEAPSTLLVVDGVTNVDNIAALFRNAAAFACDGVLLSPSCHDPLYRKALRVSLGHVLSLPWARVDDFGAALDELAVQGFERVATALSPDSVALDELLPPRRLALIVGQEKKGISPATAERADHLLKIPMAPGVDSLNVAVASAVCLHRLSTGLRS